MKELEGKVGIVTGASSGIGLAIAHSLAAQGAEVYIISRSGCTKDGEIPDIEGMHHVKGDVCDQAAMSKAVKAIADAHKGVIDILVNNAGMTHRCRAEAFPMDKFDAIMELNVRSVYVMSVLCFPYLKLSKDRGRIINITSMGAHIGLGEVVPYCASKGAVLSMTRALSSEWAGDNICVNSIAPGWFKTKLANAIQDESRTQKILNRMPMHAYGDTKDLGEMAAYLCGPSASYITGQDFAIDGGALAYGY